MTKFCTNCGHSNDAANRICIECGTALEEEKIARAEQAEKQPVVKKKLSFKSKVMAGIAIVLIASFGVFYSWGTKTASAESTVSQFFAALAEEDAEAVSKYVVRPTGENITVNEAKAFVALYKGISPDELEEFATMTKAGKLAGIFDTHKIMIQDEEAYFQFPFEGLKLKLNGEEMPFQLSPEGEYLFTGIIPGKYEAEFVYDNNGLTFEHPFGLTVPEDYDDSYGPVQIEEELPLNTIVFNVETGEQSMESVTTILIAEEEYPVSNGTTGEIGPFLLDGSLTAQAQTEFPWGNVTSEEMPIDRDDINLVVNQLEGEMEEHIVERLVAFMEEDQQAKAERDASVYTFLAPDLVKRFGDEFDQQLEWTTYYEGSLLQVNLDGESIALWDEGISVDAEVITEGATYFADEKEDLEKVKAHATVKFAYDSQTKEWIVKEYWSNTSSSRSFTLEPVRSIEGSKKMHKYKGAAASVKKETKKPEEKTAPEESETEESSEKETVNTSASAIESFMNGYNTLSSEATLTGDSSTILSYLSENGPKRKESIDYIASVYSRGISTEHLGTTVDKVETIDGTSIKVTTTERFIVHGTERTSEKEYTSVNILLQNGDSWLVDELVSTKEN